MPQNAFRRGFLDGWSSLRGDEPAPTIPACFGRTWHRRISNRHRSWRAGSLRRAADERDRDDGRVAGQSAAPITPTVEYLTLALALRTVVNELGSA
jgi:hypothetical protein